MIVKLGKQGIANSLNALAVSGYERSIYFSIPSVAIALKVFFSCDAKLKKHCTRKSFSTSKILVKDSMEFTSVFAVSALPLNLCRVNFGLPPTLNATEGKIAYQIVLSKLFLPFTVLRYVTRRGIFGVLIIISLLMFVISSLGFMPRNFEGYCSKKRRTPRIFSIKGLTVLMKSSFDSL